MASREPKTQSTTFIDVISRTGARMGRLELTPGNLIYYRRNAKDETLSLTYQQLFAVLETELEYRELDPEKVRLPGPHKDGDFRLSVEKINEDTLDLEDAFHSESSIKRLDPRRVDLGTYQFSFDMASGRRPKGRQWYAHISVQAVLWVLNRYIDKFLASRRMSNHTDKDVVVSKQKMREVLRMLLKKLES